MASDYIELDLSHYANLQELQYREKIQLTERRYGSPEKWYKRIQDGRLSIIPFLEKENIVFSGKILELGAGSCWCAAELSKTYSVRQVYALDFSRILLTEVAPYVMKYLNADITKITRVRGDFYDLSYFGEGYFDFVIFDAALHHAAFPQKTLREACRALKKGGRIICIREPVLPPWTPFKEFWRKIFGTHEKRYGVIENSRTLAEWKLIFHNAGLTFRPILLPWKQASLRLLKNLLRTSYCFEGKS
jgi:SAM-dependent methyltransferase